MAPGPSKRRESFDARWFVWGSFRRAGKPRLYGRQDARRYNLSVGTPGLTWRARIFAARNGAWMEQEPKSFDAPNDACGFFRRAGKPGSTAARDGRRYCVASMSAGFPKPEQKRAESGELKL
jgi:hypothetical protein